MTIISPVFSRVTLNLSDEIKSLNKIDNIWLHLDIMDGHFVPNLTFGHEIIERISDKSKNPIDVHLMVNNPEFYISSLSKINIHNITWHFENDADHLKLIKEAKQNFSSIGISLKPKSNIKDIPIEVLKEVDLLLVMSVEPGFGGQSFITNTYKKIEEA